MEMALKAVRINKLSIRMAAELHGVPRATLHDHVSGRVRLDGSSGPPRHLNIHEEEELAKFLIGCAEIGFPRTRKQVITIVQDHLNRKPYKSMKRVTYGWWQRFRERHPNLSLRTASVLSKPRAMAMDRETLNRYFVTLEQIMRQDGFLDKPARIFNCDESGMPLSPKPPKVIAKRGVKNVSSLSGDTKAQITILACVNAAGGWIPPMVIFDRKSLPSAFTVGEVPNTFYGLSSKGWMDSELFERWFIDHFLRYCGSDRPILLLMDGASSHFNPDMIRVALKEQVVLFVLPPHTTQVCQPLDKGVFSALKESWKQVTHSFIIENPGRVVTRYDFSSLFCGAWDNCMTIKNIKAGFRVTGVFPLNKDAIHLPEDQFMEPEFQSMSSLVDSAGISYIPLYSSSPLESIPEAENDAEDSFYSYSDYSSTCNAKSMTKQPPATPAKPLPCISSFGQLLVLPPMLSKEPTKHGKSCGRVLTSQESLAQMEEKERKKIEAASLKEERRIQREQKKLQKSIGKGIYTTCSMSVYIIIIIYNYTYIHVCIILLNSCIYNKACFFTCS